MPSEHIPIALRRQVSERAQGLCEYCRCPAHFTNAAFHCEHIQPRNAGGETALNNLAWACPCCNAHKYIKTHAFDPQTRRSIPLFNPRCQRWLRHFMWIADFMLIVGRTMAGRATVEALHLNRPEQINLRRVLYAAGEHPPHVE
ncbi:HNH endonuclease [Candidatus Poribacteria bacterium]|nr:HNH endonuclease [Candidatus Poribacteria bacterium]